MAKTSDIPLSTFDAATAAVDLGNQKLTNVADPTSDQDGATKGYVDDTILLEEALQTARTIASMSRPVVAMTKECVNTAYETTLSEGIRFERRLFCSTFSLADQKEGMAAFIEKRQPRWAHR